MTVLFKSLNLIYYCHFGPKDYHLNYTLDQGRIEALKLLLISFG